jgi:very-short-patch-repair endonuclease
MLRGPDALLRHRMDFLLLLPRGERIVLEVDGETHYAANGRPDPRQYADGVRADRELKLAGYEVFRFGAPNSRTSTAPAP